MKLFGFKEEDRFTKILRDELEVENYDKFKWNSEGYMKDSDVYFWDWVPREFSLSKDFIIENFKNLNLDSLFLYQPEFTIELSQELLKGNYRFRYISDHTYIISRFIPEDLLISNYNHRINNNDSYESNKAINEMIRYQKLPKEIVDSVPEESLMNNLFYKNANKFIEYLEVRENYGIISKNIRTTGLIFSDDIKNYFPKHKLNSLRLNKSIIRKEDLISPILATDYNVIRTVKILSY